MLMEPILSEKPHMTKMEEKSPYSNYFFVFIVLVLSIAFISIYFSKANINGGDSATYKEAMDVILGMKPSPDFVPNRILTTFLPLHLVIFSSKIFHNITSGWLILNFFLYLLSCICFYKIILNIYKNEKTAFVGGLFLAGSYGMISYGLNYLMDMGGWAFYIFSLFFTIKYIYSHERKDILLSSLFVGIGATFKEYALLASIPIGLTVLWENESSFKKSIKDLILPAFISVAPLLFVYIFVYLKFDYTYADWFGKNKETYVYPSRIIEYIKALGALYNILAFYCIFALTFFINNLKNIDKEKKLIIFVSIISFFPVFLWPAITERILFITVPGSIIFASLFFSKFEKYFWVFLFTFVLYFLFNFFLDSYILNFVNLSFFF